jgi:dihydrofolate reductase
METIIIAAVASNRVIGKDNDLVWHLPADMKFFKETTRGYPVITGRKNYDSIPEKFRPLPGRLNIVLSRDPEYIAPGAVVTSDLDLAIELAEAEGADKAFIIGGAQIYALALQEDIVDTMLLTKIEGEFEGDAWFPEFDSDLWEEEKVSFHPKDEQHSHAFAIIRLIRKR